MYPTCRDAARRVSTIPKPGVDPSRSAPGFFVNRFVLFSLLRHKRPQTPQATTAPPSRLRCIIKIVVSLQPFLQPFLSHSPIWRIFDVEVGWLNLFLHISAAHRLASHILSLIHI